MMSTSGEIYFDDMGSYLYEKTTRQRLLLDENKVSP